MTIESPKRTSIALDAETKDVFDWSMKSKGSKTTSVHLQKLLMKYHEKKDWPQLLEEFKRDIRRCKIHNEPYTLMCKDCGIALCPQCKIEPHSQHSVELYCRTHEVGYQTTCWLCERDKLKDIVEIPMITADELKNVRKKEAVVIIDTRGPSEWEEGHLPGAIRIQWVDFRLKKSEGHKQLEKLIKNHKNDRWILISQGYPKVIGSTGSARGWLAAADLKLIYRVENVACLDGGWSSFHSKFPGVVEGHESNGSQCRVCELNRRGDKKNRIKEESVCNQKRT
jgi:rhodanese-related sulfurtransferase